MELKLNATIVQRICVLYIIAWMIAPPLAYGMIYRLLAVVAAGIWILIQCSKPKVKMDSTTATTMKTYMICSIAYALILFVFRCIFDSMSILGALYNDITTYILIFIGYVGGVYCKESKWHDLKIVFNFCVILGVIFSFTTFMRGTQYEGLTRFAGGETDAKYLQMAQAAAKAGVGAFGFFCFVSVLAPMVLWVSYTQTGKRKLLYLLAFFIMEFGVVSGGYTIAFVISFIGIGLTIIFHLKSIVSKFIFIMIAIIIALFWNTFINSLYGLLLSISRDSMYENKVKDIFSFLISGESTGTFEERRRRYMLSFRSIFRNPVFGSYILEGRRSVGYHSSILDTFAAYGWLIGGAWLYVINIYPLKLMKRFPVRYAFVFFILLFVTALLNTYTMTMGVFFFVIPALGYICNSSKKEELGLQEQNK